MRRGVERGRHAGRRRNFLKKMVCKNRSAAMVPFMARKMVCYRVARFGSVRLRFVHGAVRAIPVFSSDGSLSLFQCCFESFDKQRRLRFRLLEIIGERKKTNKHKQLRGIVCPENGWGVKLFMCFPSSLGKRETHKQNP